MPSGRPPACCGGWHPPAGWCAEAERPRQSLCRWYGPTTRFSQIQRTFYDFFIEGTILSAWTTLPTAPHASQRSSDGETAAVDEADRLVPNRVVRRDFRRRRAQDALLRPGNGGLAGAVGTADGGGGIVRTAGPPPGFWPPPRARGP